jgi:uncharacterized integral membrane protein
MSAIFIIILILAILLVIFTLQNSTEITVQIFFWEIADAPLVLVLLGCIVIGYIVASFYFYPRLWNLKSENKRLAKQNKKYEDLHNTNISKGEKDDDHPEGMAFEADDGKYPFLND